MSTYQTRHRAPNVHSFEWQQLCTAVPLESAKQKEAIMSPVWIQSNCVPNYTQCSPSILSHITIRTLPPSSCAFICFSLTLCNTLAPGDSQGGDKLSLVVLFTLPNSASDTFLHCSGMQTSPRRIDYVPLLLMLTEDGRPPTDTHSRRPT